MDLAEGSKGEGEECSGSKDDGKGASGLMSPPANVGGILRCEEKTAREGSVEAGNHVPCPTRKGEKKVSTSSGAVELASPALVSRSSSSLPKSHISSSSSKPQAYRYSASSEVRRFCSSLSRHRSRRTLSRFWSFARAKRH
uniref:Uncharacterized protein n=1 Tax=Ditylum brightwellii TaxID=49249 RepID=A0A7S4RVF4_9STRA|mmetsp:Transcript_21865/g.32510  ORF Transcript_21865/g.32510 Transcript_21865/m.32510 type:complete len:141 (+) Transcript_21865:244-666(+)